MKRIFSLLIALLLLGSLATMAFAKEVPDPNGIGTLKIVMEYNAQPLSGGSLSVYQVGRIAEDDGNYSFAWIDALRGCGLSLEDPLNPALAAEAAGLTAALEEISAPVRDGAATFLDLPAGLYLVVQDADQACDGFAPIDPFVISVPNRENDAYNYNVVAHPKIPLVPKPTEPEPTVPKPTVPLGPNLPQTGQLNWPVPVMVAAGLMLFTMGWILCFGRKKEENEK